MGVMLSANWPDLLERDLRKVYIDQYKALPAMTPDLFSIQSSDGAYEKSSSVSPVPDHQEFTGKINVVERVQGLRVINIVAPVKKFGYMLEVPKALLTDKVKIGGILQWIISRKDFFGGSLDFSMARVG